MGLLLPVLLLGLTQPADQPAAMPQPKAQVLTNAGSAPATLPGTGPTIPSEKPLDRIEPYLDKCHGDPNCKVVEGPKSCLTIRSYYFERRDDLAPEFKGMTTCESMQEIRERNAKKRQKPRLVPATSDSGQ